jgi:ATP-dependent Zn protease
MNINLKTVFKLLVTALLLSILLMFYSCDIQKTAQKLKSDTGFTEQIENHIIRKGDTVHYEIPNITYKDTTIYSVNKQGTTIRTIYNKEGQMKSVDCFSSAINEFKKENRAFKESLKDKKSEKTEKLDSSFIFYIMAGLTVIIMFGFLLVFFYLKQNTNSIKSILEKTIL